MNDSERWRLERLRHGYYEENYYYRPRREEIARLSFRLSLMLVFAALLLLYFVGVR